ncbi:MAG: DNA mismatch repair protein MutS [Myxococcales bacterium]|nr:DNA mismatch repair protein MutS [Myxococcales bacterium]
MARLVSFLAILAAIIAAWQSALPSWCTAVPTLAFVILVVVHDRVFRGLDRARRAAAHYRRGLDRLDDRWFGQGVTRGDLGVVGGKEGHPFAADLDLFGEGSLFERSCRARTRAGEETLARWLSPGFDGGAGGRGPLAAVAEIRERQQAVAAGRSQLDLREELDVRGDERSVAVHPQQLIDWGRAPAVFARTGGLKVMGWISPPALVASLVAWAQGLGPWALLLLFVVNGLILRQLQPKLRRVAGPADRRGGELAILAELLAVFEGAEIDDPRLRSLRAALQAEGSASAAIAKLRRLVAWYEAQHNALFMPIALACSWAPSFALAIEGWRARHGPHIRRWIEALGELEALSSLAGYAYENPEDPFPQLVDAAADDAGGDDQDRVLAGEGLGHPLLPRASCVCNDLSLGGELRAYVVSGSNMSGKSTFLRTVGCNVVLALAGAPVRASRLRLSPMRIGATLRVQDSLRDGASRFWAELTRLRAVSELADAGPCLFLLDEILHGTNSHDRRIGAEALLRSLIDRGALGLLTTHDLALARAAESLAPRAANVHFEDSLVDGELVFDYRMRPGVVTKSNALALMRSIGLLTAEAEGSTHGSP